MRPRTIGHRARRFGAVMAAAAVVAGTLALPSNTPRAQAQASITVDTTVAGVNETDGKCSLAEAIYSANFDDNIAIKATPPDLFVTTECTAGSGTDTIVLPANAVFAMSSIVDDLYNPFGPTATPIVFTPMVLEGNGARIERSATAPFMRAFAAASSVHIDVNPGGTPDVVSGTGDLTLRNLHVKGFYARGGDGGQLGGGGGLGAGGAVYIRGALLTVDSSTFEGNRAEGGNGGNAINFDDSIGRSKITAGGGGGGGLGGSGGRGSTGSVAPSGVPVMSGGGGGGGGARGDGGTSEFDGGGGGGTVTSGAQGAYTGAGAGGGIACGGQGGYTEEDGDTVQDGGNGCSGGGGGGGASPDDPQLGFCCEGYPGHGGYGGGGGGAGRDDFQDLSVGGGAGGFGGGGGAAGRGAANGGDGGFGGGGGAGSGGDSGGAGGTFGGDGGRVPGGPPNIGAGGGGAGLGGAIFSDLGTVTVRNSTFTANSVSHGFAGSARTSGVGATNGADAGAAVFAVDGELTISNSTITGNESTGSAAAVAMYGSTRELWTATLELTNTIAAANIPTSQECQVLGDATATGSGNLFSDNGNCPGEAVTGDPSLAELAIEAPGVTPTMAIDDTSPAYDAGDDDTCERFDQRGVSRPRSLHCDIGAYELVPPSADLAVGTTPMGTAVAGENLAYLIDVHNNGPTVAEGVTLVDTLPTGTVFASITGSGGFSCAGTGPVSCTNPLMAEGATALFTLTVLVGPTVPSGTSITNTVNVSSSTTPDPVPANNSAAVTSTVSTRANLSVTKQGPASPIAGTDVTYPIVVRNSGPSVARNVVLTDDIPAGVSFRSLVAPAGWTCVTPAVGGVGPAAVTCSSPSMAPATTAGFTLAVRLAPSAADGSQLCNAASVATSTPDPDVDNNASQTCGTVQRLADLRVAQTVTKTGKPGRGTATFTVTVTNLGPSDSQNVSLTATSSLFTGPPPTTSTSSGATCTVGDGTVMCSWASLASGASVQAIVTVEWRSSVGSTCTSVTVTAGTADPNATNNNGSVCISKR